jgi:hypothetical protein
VEVLSDIAPYAVSGLIALLGVWLGKRWERRTSLESWIRDRRLSAYARLLTASHDVWTGVNHIYVAYPTDFVPLTQALTEPIAAFGAACSEADLLGPTAMDEPFVEFREAVRALAVFPEEEQAVVALRAKHGGAFERVPAAMRVIVAEQDFVRRGRSVIQSGGD